jgi:hypothetical protein
MTVTVQLKLMPDAATAASMEATLRACNGAADWLSERAWGNPEIRAVRFAIRFLQGHSGNV